MAVAWMGHGGDFHPASAVLSPWNLISAWRQINDCLAQFYNSFLAFLARLEKHKANRRSQQT